MLDEEDKGLQKYLNYLDEDMMDMEEKDNKTENKDAKNNNSLSQSEKNQLYFKNQNRTELLNRKTFREQKQKKINSEKSQKEIKEEILKEEEKFDDDYLMNSFEGDKNNFYDDFDFASVEVNKSQQSYKYSENQRDEDFPEVNKKISMTEITKDNTKKNYI